MRTLKPARWIRIQVFIGAIVMMVVVVPGATAQEAIAPDLGSGWELRLQQSMGLWSSVAGSADTGFVVRGLTGIAFWSPDGVEWQAVTDSVGREPVFDLAANDSGFVAVSGARLPSNSVLFSPDGRTWETVGVGTSADFWRVESGAEGFFLVSGCDFVVRFSMDGRDWVPAEIPAGCGNFLTAQTSGGWIGVAERNESFLVLSSSDGTTWSEIETQGPLPELPPATSWPGHEAALRSASLSSDGETLVLAGKGLRGGLWVSMDEGITWEDTGTDGDVEMTVSDFGFVGVAPQRVLVSRDGTSWVEHRVDDVEFHDVAAVGSTLVATANDGIYTWIAPPASLAGTGTNPTALLGLAAILSAIGGVTLALRRHVIKRAPQAVS